jgi:hypothetical protein
MAHELLRDPEPRAFLLPPFAPGAKGLLRLQVTYQGLWRFDPVPGFLVNPFFDFCRTQLMA